jgi:hypothetical protein
MARVRPGAAERWVRRASAAAQDYQAGIENPRQSWQQAASQARENWAQGVQQAVQGNRYATGVQRAGDEKWRRKAIAKGVSRYGPGVAEAQNDYAAAVAPYLQTIESLSLPPRGPKGDPRNLERVRVIAQALRNRKLGGGGGATGR